MRHGVEGDETPTSGLAQNGPRLVPWRRRLPGGLLAGAAVAASGCASVPPSPEGPPPVLERVALREQPGRYDHVYPTFFFRAETGDVVEIRREILASNAPHPHFHPVSPIRIDAARQKSGAVFVGGWSCGPEPSVTTLRAVLVDARGRQSNSVDYTVVCRGVGDLVQGAPKGA